MLNRYSPIIAFILLLASHQSGSAQEVVNTYKNYVRLNLGEESGVRAGDILSLLRELDTGEILEVGKVLILEFHQAKCIGKVVALKPRYGFKVGDFVAVPGMAVPGINKGRSRILSYSLIGAGILAAGGALLLHNEASQTYSDYEAAQTTADAVRLYDETATFDQRAQIGLLLVTMLCVVTHCRTLRVQLPTQSVVGSVPTRSMGTRQTRLNG